MTSTFFLTWFPTYLVTYRHLDFIKAGFLASLPFLAAFVGVLCSGLASDALVRFGCSLSVDVYKRQVRGYPGYRRSRQWRWCHA